MLERLHDVSEATELLGTELREHDAQMQALPRGRTRAGREGRRCIGDADQQHRFVLDADDGARRGALPWTGVARPPDPPAPVAATTGGSVTVTEDPREATAGVNAVITDTWVSMHDAQSAKERRHNLLRPYQVNARLMAAAAPEAVFLHCLPAHRGEEVSAGVIDGPQSAVWEEAANRVHAQKALLLWALGRLG